MSHTKRFVILAAALGLLLGVAAALAIPRQSRSATEAQRPFVAPTAPLRKAPARATERKGPSGGVSLRLHPGTLHEELRAKDPAGGPDWVLRRYTADRVVPGPLRRHGVDPVVGTGPCVQLGREVGGQFGWIDGANVFRTVSTASTIGAPHKCFSLRLATQKNPDPGVELTTLVSDPAGPNASVRGSVVWGVTGGAEKATGTAAGRPFNPSLSSHIGAFLAFFGPGRSPSDAALSITYAGRSDAVQAGVGMTRAQMPAGFRRAVPEVDAATAQVAARTFDPGGGPSWGLVAVKSKDGYWCAGQQGSLVGNRVGQVDAVLGTLWEQNAGQLPSGCQKNPFAKDRPIMLGTTFGSDPARAGLDPARGRLRLQPGCTTLSGLVDPDADLLTIITPRDVRTVEPTGAAHAFIAVYDGDFPGGTATFKVHMKDGSTRTMHASLGF